MTHYIGRFAPSPSGLLHFGSFVTALGSYLRARYHNGTWLVRIEDLDPPREVQGSATSILSTLEAFGLHWDQEVTYQSQRHHAYQEAIAHLFETKQAYYCSCTRKEISAMGGSYNGHCRSLALKPDQNAIRVVNPQNRASFFDQLRGDIIVPEHLAHEDFTIKRRDGLFAYQLAVVIDDAQANITEVVRGADLLYPTMHQQTLYDLLHLKSPKWFHLPLIVQSDGRKLSKQNKAMPIHDTHKMDILVKALVFLNQDIPDEYQDLSYEALLEYAAQHFNVISIPKTDQILKVI